MRGMARLFLFIDISVAQLWKTAPCETSAAIVKVLLPPKNPGRGVVELDILWENSLSVIGVDVVVGSGGFNVVNSSLSSTL